MTSRTTQLHVDGKDSRNLSWLSFPDRVRFFRMTHLFCIRHKLAPGYLLNNFKAISDAHSHNTRGSNFNYVLSRELSLAPTGFSFLAIKQWNALPNDIKSLTELRVFKRRLKEFFISQYDWYYWILSDWFIMFMALILTFLHDFTILWSLWIFMLKDPVGKKFLCDFNGLSSEASLTFHGICNFVCLCKLNSFIHIQYDSSRLQHFMRT